MTTAITSWGQFRRYIRASVSDPDRLRRARRIAVELGLLRQLAKGSK